MVRGHGEAQLSVHLVGCQGCPLLPGLDGSSRVYRRPPDLEAGHGLWCGDCIEQQRGHHSEVAEASSTQRPEQLGLMLGVAIDDAPVGEHDPGAHESVAGQPVSTAEHTEPAAQGEPGDADRRPATHRQRPARRRQGPRKVPEPGPGAHLGGRARPHHRLRHIGIITRIRR